MRDTDENREKRVKKIFEDALRVEVMPNPHFTTRVMATMEEKKAKATGLFWKRLAFAGPLAVCAVFLFIIFMNAPSFKVAVGENVLLKIEVSELPRGEVAFTQIELPEGVSFYSKKFPELNEQSDLELVWNGHFPERNLPLVIKSNSDGTKRVTVRFLDVNRNIIAERSLKIKFADHV